LLFSTSNYGWDKFIAKYVMGTAHFSADLSQRIKNTLSIGNSISKALEGIEGISAKASILKSMSDCKTIQSSAIPEATHYEHEVDLSVA